MRGRAADGEMGREGAEARFEQLYGRHGRAVLAYAVRRADQPADAADVVAETFLVAWRRLDDVPAGDAARLWLYGVARRVMANLARSEQRRLRLAERLRRELPTVLADASPTDPAVGRLAAALERLSPEDREILRLSGWEGLEPAEIAVVLEIGAVAARSRLHRARRRLRGAIRVSGPAPACASPEEVHIAPVQEAG